MCLGKWERSLHPWRSEGNGEYRKFTWCERNVKKKATLNGTRGIFCNWKWLNSFVKSTLFPPSAGDSESDVLYEGKCVRSRKHVFYSIKFSHLTWICYKQTVSALMLMPKVKKGSEFKIVFTQKRRVGDNLLLLASAAIRRLISFSFI